MYNLGVRFRLVTSLSLVCPVCAYACRAFSGSSVFCLLWRVQFVVFLFNLAGVACCVLCLSWVCVGGSLGFLAFGLVRNACMPEGGR